LNGRRKKSGCVPQKVILIAAQTVDMSLFIPSDEGKKSDIPRQA
jgi:hypothetical protein